jgi:hypothetical protein
MDFNHWLFLYEWYSKLKASVRWNGVQSDFFTVTRGIRQGSLLSPIFFTFFIDGLLMELGRTNSGLRIGQLLINNFAYADDLNLLAANVPDLQTLIGVCKNIFLHVCNDYSKRWQFVFGFAKTKCITFGKVNFS